MYATAIENLPSAQAAYNAAGVAHADACDAYDAASKYGHVASMRTTCATMDATAAALKDASFAIRRALSDVAKEAAWAARDADGVAKRADWAAHLAAKRAASV